jgi:hypothetical protein
MHCILTSFAVLVVLLFQSSIAKETAKEELASVAGKYKCNAVHGNLSIIKRNDEKLEFDLDAIWIGDYTVGNVNTGSAHGVITLEGNSATYKDPEGPYTLTFLFKRDVVDIEYDGSGFGQWNVTPAGRYKRVRESK